MNHRPPSSFGAILLLAVGCARDFKPSKAKPEASHEQETPPALDEAAKQSLRIPKGRECLDLLNKLGVKHRVVQPIRGVNTPVEITGPIGGIRYTLDGRVSLTSDCRLALALHWAAPVLSAHRVVEVQISGAYVYRTTSSGNPSRHAEGLAVDAHRFRFQDIPLMSVERDFVRGLGSGCQPKSPELNKIACELRKLQLFRELITPDHNEDHHDHFHLAIAPE